MDGVVYYGSDADEVIELNEKKWAQVGIDEDWVWGLDTRGELYYLDYSYEGNINENQGYIKADEFFERNNDLENITIVKISEGDSYTAAIDNKGKVYMWGHNAYGQFGNGTTYSSIWPICISEIEGNLLNGKKIVDISAGDLHTTALSK